MLALTDTLKQGGGLVYMGGTVPHEALAQVSAEIEAAGSQEEQNA